MTNLEAGSQPTDEEGPKPLWRLEPLADFRAPPASVSELARTGFRGLFQRFRPQAPSVEANDDPDLLAFSADELEKLVPGVALDAIGDGVPASDPTWWEATAPARLCVIVEPPPGDGLELATMLARARSIPILQPPAPSALLDGAEPVLRSLERRADEPLAIPHLERWFLRHPHALGTLRELLAAIALRRRSTLVSCGSWAWAWLRAALQVDALLPKPLALAAFDADALTSWLGGAATDRVVCRAPDGKWVVPPVQPEGEPPTGESSAFLRHLAAEARGNPLVARALWTAALRRPTEGTFDGVDVPAGVAKLAAVPWARLSRPSFEGRARFEEVAVLHSLLLHGALSLDVLDRVLPFGRAALSRCLAGLAGLAGAHLVELCDEAWRVPAAGYPAVRRELLSAGIPADDL